MIARILVAASAALTALPALADETWTTEQGKLVWVETWGDLAVLEITDPDGTGVQIIVDNLGRNHDDRGVSTGLWYANGDIGEEECAFPLINPMTREATHVWGRVRLTFTHPRWDLADFRGLVGACEETPETGFDGTHD